MHAHLHLLIHLSTHSYSQTHTRTSIYLSICISVYLSLSHIHTYTDLKHHDRLMLKKQKQALTLKYPSNMEMISSGKITRMSSEMTTHVGGYVSFLSLKRSLAVSFSFILCRAFSSNRCRYFVHWKIKILIFQTEVCCINMAGT